MVEIGLPSSRVHLIPNGLDTQIFRPTTGPDREQARARLGLDASPLVVTVCRLSPEKKLPGLLEAWARIRPAHPEARLAIVGDGSEMPGLRKQAERLGLGGSLLLPGNCSDPESWYFAGDMYVLCSSHEGLSNSLIEALCCGLPIVSTRVSGSEDILAAVDVGLLVPVDDEDALGDAISELLADPERARACGRRAGEYGTAHYSLASVTEQVERLYAGVTGINPAP